MIENIYELYKKHPLVSTDTRNLPKDSIFFALKGDNFNGNKYAQDALNNGAAYAVIDEKEYDNSQNTILVENVLETLQKLANHHRKLLDIPFVGITGSNGKTTTKELMREVLARKYKVQATIGNLNNHIGVPLTILSIRKEHELAIIEMGANHIGEIRELCAIAEPDSGLITNIGKAHIEGFGSYEGVIKAKTELYVHLVNRNGQVFVNTDDLLLTGQLGGYKNIFTYGTEEADVTGQLTAPMPFVELAWQIKGKVKCSMKSNLFGKYNFENILAAICVGTFYGVSAEDITEAIEAYHPSNNRSQLIKTAGNTIYLDAYNANPSSVKKAIESFSAINSDKKMIILGDMLELGPESKKEHQKVVDLLEGLKNTRILLVGNEFYHTELHTACLRFPSNKELFEWLKTVTLNDFHILIKGSRRIQLEKAVDYIG